MLDKIRVSGLVDAIVEVECMKYSKTISVAIVSCKFLWMFHKTKSYKIFEIFYKYIFQKSSELLGGCTNHINYNYIINY